MVLPAKTKADLLEMLSGILPSSFLRPLEELEEGLGLDPYAAAAAIMERVGQAIDLTSQAYYLKAHSDQTQDPSAAEARATVAVTIVRTGDASPALTLVAGLQLQSELRTSTGATILGPIFELTADVSLAAGSLSAPATVQAVRPGWQGNVPAGRIVRFVPVRTLTVTADVVGSAGANALTDNGLPDRFARDLVGRYVSFTSGANTAAEPRRITDASTGSVVVDGAALTGETGASVSVLSWADLGLSISQTAAATGGRHAFLDAIGEERRQGRRNGETDAAYRARVCQLADTICPAAIERIASLILDPIGIGWELKETRDPSSWPSLIYDTTSPPTGIVNAYDQGDFFTAGYVDGCQEVAAFAICVGVSNDGEFGFSYDANDPDVLTAYDVGGAYDGYAIGWRAALGALYDAVDAARAAGVCFDLVLDPTL